MEALDITVEPRAAPLEPLVAPADKGSFLFISFLSFFSLSERTSGVSPVIVKFVEARMSVLPTQTSSSVAATLQPRQ